MRKNLHEYYLTILQISDLIFSIFFCIVSNSWNFATARNPVKLNILFMVHFIFICKIQTKIFKLYHKKIIV